MPTFTPAEAADRSGYSRMTISNALREGELHGIRDNRGHWIIEEADLAAWLADKGGAKEPDPVADNGGENGTDSAETVTDNRLTKLTEEVARLTAESAAKDERIGDLLAQIERLDGAHRGHLDDLRALHAAERDRMTAAHGDTVTDLRSQIGDLRSDLAEARKPWIRRVLGR